MSVARSGAGGVGSSLPSGTVTFLFTDIEGSTNLWSDAPEAMARALARHDEIVRSVIAAHRGVLFSTSGDGSAACFGRASDAVSAALEAQLAVTTERWPASKLNAAATGHS